METTQVDGKMGKGMRGAIVLKKEGRTAFLWGERSSGKIFL
jgi:hypothetical protein